MDEIILNALELFEKCEPSTLKQDELSFFDDQIDEIVQELLPAPHENPEKEREKRLITEDAIEHKNEKAKHKLTSEDECSFDIEADLRRTIKTVEVMGRIIKNRAGSLEKSRLEFVFEEAMNVHLRILTYFFEIIKKEEEQQTTVEYISHRLSKIIRDKAEERKKEGKKEQLPTKKEIEKLSKSIYWNFNFAVVYGLISKIIHSLGSDKLNTIVEKVCDEQNTPASFLVKHGILMWYGKNLQVEAIAKRLADKDFSDIGRKVMRFMIANHCSIHQVGYKDIQRIEQNFNIPSKSILIEQAKRKEEE